MPPSAWIENASTMRHRAQPFGRLVRLAAGKAVIAARGRLADRAIDSEHSERVGPPPPLPNGAHSTVLDSSC